MSFELVTTLTIAWLVFREHLGRRLVTAAGLIALAVVPLVWHPGIVLDIGGPVGSRCRPPQR